MASTANFEKEYGSPAVLEAVQNDPEFAQYISFVRYNNMQEALNQEPQSWNLRKVFDESRN